MSSNGGRELYSDSSKQTLQFGGNTSVENTRILAQRVNSNGRGRSLTGFIQKSYACRGSPTHPDSSRDPISLDPNQRLNLRPLKLGLGQDHGSQYEASIEDFNETVLQQAHFHAKP